MALLRAPSWARLGALLGRLGRLLGRLGAVLGRLRAVLGASWAVLGPSSGPLGLFWSVEKPKTRKPPNPSKTIEKSMILASRGPLGRPLGGFLERLGGLLARLGAILGVLGRCFGDSGPSWTVLGASWGSLGPSWGPLGPEKVTRQAAGRPGRFGNLGSGPLNDSSGLRTEAQGIGQGT